MNTLLIKLGKTLVAFSFLVTALNVNSACMFIQNQPELPKGSDRFRRL